MNAQFCKTTTFCSAERAPQNKDSEEMVLLVQTSIANAIIASSMYILCIQNQAQTGLETLTEQTFARSEAAPAPFKGGESTNRSLVLQAKPGTCL